MLSRDPKTTRTVGIMQACATCCYLRNLGTFLMFIVSYILPGHRPHSQTRLRISNTIFYRFTYVLCETGYRPSLVTGCFRVIRPERVQATWQGREREMKRFRLRELFVSKRCFRHTEEHDRRGKRMYIRSRGLSTTEFYIPGA